MTTNLDRVEAAARRLAVSPQRDTWAFADSIVEYLDEDPDMHSTAQLAKELKARGVYNFMGEFWSAPALKDLALVAEAWPVNVRHPEAAFTAHQEAGKPNTDGGRALSALVKVANKERATKPKSLDADAWQQACDSVQNRSKGWPVSKRDVREALARATGRGGGGGGGGGGGSVTIDDVQAALDSGDLSPSAVADILPTEVIEDEYDERVEEEIAQNAIASGEGMTAEEDAEFEHGIQGLYGLVDGLKSALTGLEAEVRGGVLMQWAEKVLHQAGAFLALCRKHGPKADDVERDRVTGVIAQTMHLLDLAKMALQGTPSEDEIDAALERLLGEAS